MKPKGASQRRANPLIEEIAAIDPGSGLPNGSTDRVHSMKPAGWVRRGGASRGLAV